MMRKTIALTFLCVLVFSELHAHAQSQAESGDADSMQPTGENGFVPLDPEKRPTINGKNLLIGAYSIILAIFFLYAISLVRRERNVQNDAKDLVERARGPASS
ncbi:MAG: hypothetical protein GY854_33720 [Deltaproteobacteria bacterium]|nr:hypothetical protein [Deltaproteobacteria bacterium]